MKYIIRKKDLIIERFAASSRGGQNANKTEVNVRITHLPSGIKSQATGERSLAQNLQNAMNVLVARIIEWLRSSDPKSSVKPPAARGYARRTYRDVGERDVIDHETGVSSKFYDVVTKANIDDFINANIRKSLH